MSTESVAAANTGDSGIGPLARQTGRDIAVAVEQLVSGWKQATVAVAECQAKRDVVAGAIERARTDFRQKFPELMATEPSATSSGERWDYLVTRQHDGRWYLRADVQKTLESTSGAISSALYPYKKSWWESKGALMTNATPHIDRFWRTVRGMELERDRLAAEIDQLTERRTTDAQTTASRASAHLQASSRALLDAQRDLADVMAPWLSTSWGRWTPPPAPSEAVYVGATKLRSGQVPPPNERFGLDLSLPVFASLRTGLHVIHDRSSRSSAHGLARSIIFRALAATPPGKLRLSIFDPLGLGQSVASILELAEFDRDLLGGKVWSSSEDLRHVLDTHVAHTELVIQKYLRAEFSTLDAFNVAAGEIAEPYRLFVVFDAPERIDEPLFAELRRIVENGPRCGIATLLVSDTSAATRHGVDMSLLPDSFPTMRISAPISEAINSEHVLFDFVPETDELVSPEVTKSIIHLVGLGARESSSSAVSFERVFGLFNDAALDGRNRGLPQISARIEATDSSRVQP